MVEKARIVMTGDSTGSASARLRELIARWRDGVARGGPRFWLTVADEVEAALGAVDVPTPAQPAPEIQAHCLSEGDTARVSMCIPTSMNLAASSTKLDASYADGWNACRAEMLKQFEKYSALRADVPPPQPSESKSELVSARNRIRDAIVALRGGHSARTDEADHALAALDIAIGGVGMTTTTPLEKP